MEKDWVYLNIDKHRMYVSLTLKEPEGEEHPIFSAEFIEKYLRENGINAGIDKAAIMALSKYVNYGQEIVVAKGKPAVNGRDGFYQYTVSLEDAKNKPRINSDGSVDYYNSLKLAMVEEDDLIAVYVPPTGGEYGYTVFSEMLPPKKGRDLRPLRGKDLKVSEDGREYRAAHAGRIYKQDERIFIDNIYIVKGDLDISKGNVDFNGDVEVKGDVRSGLSIKAEGNIYIHGHVGSAQLTAGGNITIKKGIQGRDKCVITAGGEVAASFVERCKIEAEGNVYANYLLDTKVFSKQKVIVMSQQGLIVGGSIYAMQGIHAKEVGNDTDINTGLTIGVLPDYIRKINELNEKLKKLKSDIELLDRNMKICDGIEGAKRTKETENVRMKIVRAKVILTTEEKKLLEQISSMTGEAERSKAEATVDIDGVVYPGVKVTVARSTYSVKEAYRNVTFKLINHDVVMKAQE